MNLTHLCSDSRCVVQYLEVDSNTLAISQTSTGQDHCQLVRAYIQTSSTVYVLPVPENLHSQREFVILERNSFVYLREGGVHKSLVPVRANYNILYCGT